MGLVAAASAGMVAGGIVLGSGAAEAAGAAGAPTSTLTPVANAYVEANNQAGANFGTASALKVDGSPTTNSYLRFNVTVPSGEKVTRATLKLFTTQSVSSAFTVHRVTDSL